MTARFESAHRPLTMQGMIGIMKAAGRDADVFGKAPYQVLTLNLTQTMAKVARLYRGFLREVGKSVSTRPSRSSLRCIR